MFRRARPILLAFLVLLGLALGWDATTFGYQMPDPSRNKAAGCYTLLDDLFGTTRPSDVLRSIELALTVIFLGAAVAIPFRAWRRTARINSQPSA